jgi:hypothetical protein
MPQIFAKTARTLPSPSPDANQVQPRLGAYGDLQTIQLMDNHSSLADEGSYFKLVNATPSTAITHAATQSFAGTAALFTINNTNAAGGKRIFLDYVRLIVVTTPTTASSCQLVVTLDPASRYSSGGTSITPTNVNMDSSRASGGTCFFGAVVLTAETVNTRRISRFSVKTQATPCLTVGDIISVDCGEHSSAAAPLAGSTPQVLPCSIGPAIIGGGQALNFHLFYPAATVAPTYEFEIGYWER